MSDCLDPTLAKEERPAGPAGRDAALLMLRQLVGRDSAAFHEGQWEAIETLVYQRRRALVVQRTGWGKSAVYFVATLLLRQSGAGPTILISPLLALMRDQVAAAGRAGVRAVAINSANAHEWSEVQHQLETDEVDVLLVSPERLNNPKFRDEQLPSLLRHAGLLVVDEAHCISDWGHDFRPDYRRIRDLIAALPGGIPVLATTATANSRVVEDIADQLSSNQLSADQLSADGRGVGELHGLGDRTGSSVHTGVITIRGALARASLRLGVLRLPDSKARLAWLLTHLDDLPGSGIIYCLTVTAAEDTARLLRVAGHEVLAYTGRTDPAEREQLEQRLKNNQVKALVATSALGMGFDKPDLGFVLHLGAPSSPVAYYQQVGRAGRATDSADVLLLPGVEDEAIWQYFATSSMPVESTALAVIAELSAVAVSTPALEARVALKRSGLELLLKVLDVDGAVKKVAGGWIATGAPWKYDSERYERIAAARAAEQQSMLDYEATDACRMEFLQRALDDDSAVPCGRCDGCAGAWYPTGLASEAEAAASASLNQVGVVLEPRAQWPVAMDRLGIAVKGNIAPTARCSPGRALARLTDLGWGNTLREIFAATHTDTPASAAIIAACVRVLSDWNWDERPAAVVSINSRRHPLLITSIADGLAKAGRIPYLGALHPQNGGVSGAPGGNSAYRLAGVFDKFSATGLDIPPGKPVLLVDDLVDSRWTLTVAGLALHSAGAGAILPFALALRA